MSDLVQDLRYAVRSFFRDPGFTAVAIVTLALGVGATTAVFSVIDGVLLRPLPYPNGDRLIFIGTYLPNLDDDLSAVSEGNLVDLTAQARTLEAVAGSGGVSFTLLGDGDPELIGAARVGLEFFPMLGIEPSLGRVFAADDFAPGAPHVAVLERGFWQERWGADPRVVGRTITLDQEPYTIIGTAPAGFHPPEALSGQTDARLWVPLRIADPPGRTSFRYHALGLLAPGTTLQSAAAEIDRIFRAQTVESDRGSWEIGGGAEMLRDRTVSGAGEALWLLLLGVAFLLLIACANVAGLLLVRGTRRAREIAVRRSLGAGRWRLARQLLTESVLLALAGGLAGALLSYWAVQAFKAGGPGGIPRLEEVSVDLRVLLAAISVSAAVGLLFGLAPAQQGLRSDACAGLRAAAGAKRASAGGGRGRGVLVVAESALALMLVIGAGLLANSFVRMTRVDPGFDPRGLVGMRVNLRDAYPERESWLPLFRQLLEGVKSIRGVESASLTTSMPFASVGIVQEVVPLDSVDEGAAGWIPSTYISADHFRNMGMALLEGSGFDQRSASEAPLETIVNDAMAATYWPDAESVIGKRIRMGDDPDDEVATVVGRVGSLRYRQDRDPSAEMYFPMEAFPWRSMWVVARTRGEPSSLARPMREALWRIDADLPVDRVAPVEEMAWERIGRPRFYSALAAALAAVALVLALVGLSGTMAYAVSARVREIGIRVALGAKPGGVVALVLRGGVALAAAGIALGLGGALGVSRLLDSFLFGIAPTDPPTFLAAAALFFIIALVACWLPARRAARLDPVVALRADA